MSIQFNWDKLTEDSDQIEQQISKFLHDQFQSVELPPFISSLDVSSFKLGSVPPEITLKHFSDPFPEFLEADHELDEEEARENDEDGDTSSVASSAEDEQDATTIVYPSSRTPPQQTSPLLNSQSSAASFVPPLPPLPKSPGVPDIRVSSGDQRQPSLNYTMLDDSATNSEAGDDTGEHLKPGPFDIQSYVELKYAGDMQLGISATLQLNYPAPSFISLPLSIKVTNIDIHSLIVVAVVRNRVHLSVLNDVNTDDSVPSDRVNVIRGMKIESSIGDNADHGSMLRNVGKVEKFVLEQLRNVIREELVWPGWLTLEL